MKKEKPKWKERVADFIQGLIVVDYIHGIIILALLAYTLRAVFCGGTGCGEKSFWEGFKTAILNAGINEIFTFIGAVAFILFGLVGIYEYSYLNEIKILVPPAYKRMRKRADREQARTMMQIYYEKDIEFIQQYEEQRIEYTLQALGIQSNQFRDIRYEVIKARAVKAKSKKELRQKAKAILFNKRYINDLTKIRTDERVYKEVDYFLNLYTALYDKQLRDDIGSIMSDYITQCMKEEIEGIDYIVIPRNSNFLLGLVVGEILRIPVIAIKTESRIKTDVYWDGIYIPKNKNKIIVVHDVLVTGRRIYESVEKLPKDTYEVKGLFCLAQYDNKVDSRKVLKKHGIDNVHCLLETSDDELKKIFKIGRSES